MKKEVKSLRQLRAKQIDKKATFKCDNCGCMRYSPCGCQTKAENE